MYECLFSPNCTEDTCDKACPILAQISHLMSMNNIDIRCPVINYSKTNKKSYDNCLKFLDKLASSNKLFGVVTADNTITGAELVTYLGICEHWKGSRLHCTVYNLQYSKFLEMTKQSWNFKVESDNLQYMNIWTQQAKLLIISNIDYVNFGDYECQTLLNLLQYREANRLQTVIVAPTSSLFGRSSFLPTLQSKIKNKEGVNTKV